MWRNMPTKTSLKRNRYEKKYLNRNIFPKNLSRNFSIKKYLNNNIPRKLCRDILCAKIEETSRPKCLSRDISVPKNLEKNLNEKNIWREIYTQQNEETSPPKDLKKNHSKKHGKNQNWWNLMKKCGFYISSVSMFAIFRFKKTEVLLWRFLLKSFLAEISFWMGFLVEMPLQILFGRGLFWNLVG